jgi:hypothetical protein
LRYAVLPELHPADTAEAGLWKFALRMVIEHLIE